jgi:GPH family glycoside/pentoside/hexuronide:cation symporter
VLPVVLYACNAAFMTLYPLGGRSDVVRLPEIDPDQEQA